MRPVCRCGMDDVERRDGQGARRNLPLVSAPQIGGIVPGPLAVQEVVEGIDVVEGHRVDRDWIGALRGWIAHEELGTRPQGVSDWG